MTDTRVEVRGCDGNWTIYVDDRADETFDTRERAVGEAEWRYGRKPPVIVQSSVSVVMKVG